MQRPLPCTFALALDGFRMGRRKFIVLTDPSRVNVTRGSVARYCPGGDAKGTLAGPANPKVRIVPGLESDEGGRRPLGLLSSDLRWNHSIAHLLHLLQSLSVFNTSRLIRSKGTRERMQKRHSDGEAGTMTYERKRSRLNVDGNAVTVLNAVERRASSKPPAE